MNERAEESVVRQDAAKRLDAIRAPLNQLGLSFVQIGTDKKVIYHYRARATEMLDNKADLAFFFDRLKKL